MTFYQWWNTPHPLAKIVLKVVFCNSQYLPRISLYFLNIAKFFVSSCFNLGNNQKLHGIVFGLYKGWWSWTMPCLIKNFWIRDEWADYRSAAVCSYFSTNADVFSSLHHAIYCKDFQIILLVCATLWNIFVIYNTLLIKDNSEHCLHVAPTLMSFLASRLFFRRLLQRLCFCFRFVAINRVSPRNMEDSN